MGKTDEGECLINGKVLKADPFSALEYEFSIPKFMGDVVSHVAWSIEEVEGGVRLSLVHSGLPQGQKSFDLLYNFDKGWHGHINTMRENIQAISH